MQLYRLQATIGEDWITEWFPTLRDADRAFRNMRNVWRGHVTRYQEIRLEKVKVPTGREAFCELLNHSDANFSVIPGELVLLTTMPPKGDA